MASKRFRQAGILSPAWAPGTRRLTIPDSTHRRSLPLAHSVTLIRGDGTGPELVAAAKRVLEATGVEFNWDIQEAGVDIMETAGTPLPPSVLESIRHNKVALKGPITTPIGVGFRSVNVALRKELNLY